LRPRLTPAALARADHHQFWYFDILVFWYFGILVFWYALPADPVAALPPALTLRVFALDTRLRCAEVCPGWHKALADSSLWAELDFTQLTRGVACTEALVCAATKRARGGLQTLRLPECGLRWATIRRIAAANAATLRELRFEQSSAPQRCECLVEVLRAAPQLRLLETDVHCLTLEEAQRVLRREPPFGALRMRRLGVNLTGNEDGAVAVLMLAADLAASTATFTGLRLHSAPLHDQAALDAVVDAALPRSLLTVEFFHCGLSRSSAPALARLLHGSALTHFAVRDQYGGNLLDEPAAALLGAALRASTSLTSLSLQNVWLWSRPAAAVALIDAVTAHPRLRTLNLAGNEIGDDADAYAQLVAGAALSRLLLADAPALQTLRIGGCNLRNAGWGPVFDALPRNTHLRELNCDNNLMTEAVARDLLLPAVRANTSLRELRADRNHDAAIEAMELVANRRREAGEN
jgi:hypothetical protein